jgi:hypothetical protein
VTSNCHPQEAGNSEEVSQYGDDGARMNAIELVSIIGDEQTSVECEHRSDQLDDRLAECVRIERSAFSMIGTL